MEFSVLRYGNEWFGTTVPNNKQESKLDLERHDFSDSTPSLMHMQHKSTLLTGRAVHLSLSVLLDIQEDETKIMSLNCVSGIQITVKERPRAQIPM